MGSAVDRGLLVGRPDPHTFRLRGYVPDKCGLLTRCFYVFVHVHVCLCILVRTCVEPAATTAETMEAGVSTSVTRLDTSELASLHQVKSGPRTVYGAGPAYPMQSIATKPVCEREVLVNEQLLGSTGGIGQPCPPPPPPPSDSAPRLGSAKLKGTVDGALKSKSGEYDVTGNEVDMSLEVAALRRDVQRHWEAVRQQDPVAQMHVSSQDPVTRIASATRISSQDPVTEIASATHISSQDPVTEIASGAHISSLEDPVTQIASETHIASRRGSPSISLLRQPMCNDSASVVQSQQADPTTELASVYHSIIAAPSQLECVVCLVQRAHMALIPCGHKCVCKDCLQVLRDANASCPMCRHVIRDAIHVFD